MRQRALAHEPISLGRDGNLSTDTGGCDGRNSTLVNLTSHSARWRARTLRRRTQQTRASWPRGGCPCRQVRRVIEKRLQHDAKARLPVKKRPDHFPTRRRSTWNSTKFQTHASNERIVLRPEPEQETGRSGTETEFDAERSANESGGERLQVEQPACAGRPRIRHCGASRGLFRSRRHAPAAALNEATRRHRPWLCRLRRAKRRFELGLKHGNGRRSGDHSGTGRISTQTVCRPSPPDVRHDVPAAFRFLGAGFHGSSHGRHRGRNASSGESRKCVSRAMRGALLQRPPPDRQASQQDGDQRKQQRNRLVKSANHLGLPTEPNVLLFMEPTIQWPAPLTPPIPKQSPRKRLNPGRHQNSVAAFSVSNRTSAAPQHLLCDGFSPVYDRRFILPVRKAGSTQGTQFHAAGGV